MLRLGRHVLIALALLLPGPALARPAVWTVHDADSTIVLFGSVHMLPPGVDWAPDALKDALQKADDVWFEIKPDEATSEEVAALAARRALLPPGQTLSRLLDPASRRRLRALEAKTGLTPSQLEPLQPWMAEIQLMVAFLQRRGSTAADGVEAKVMALAPPEAKVESLETPAQQVGFLSGGTRKAQLQSLRETLRELADDPGGFDRLVRAWQAGDVRTVRREAVDTLRKAAPESYRTLVRERNRRWTEQVIGRLSGSGVTVMVVGAGHLVGPDSLPAMLRRRGVAVDGP